MSEEFGDDRAAGETVALYVFTVRIGDALYGGQMPAASREAARAAIEGFGGTLDGISCETISDRLCAVCTGEIRRDTSCPQPVADPCEFFDEFDEFE